MHLPGLCRVLPDTHTSVGFFMKKQTYSKPPLSVEEQIKLLKTRGLHIADEEKATMYLNNISYYRLSGYMYPFLEDAKQHLYKENTTFEDIMNLYRFDRELRLLLFAAIEKIEVAIRSQIINHFSVNTKDPFWYTKEKYFSNPAKHADFFNNLSSYINRSNDVFIKHFYNTYNEQYPPIWIILEILSMGQLSILYNNTIKSPSKKAIADYFGIKEPILANWLHTLVYVRNICAHHARLWNKDMRIQVKNPRKTSNIWLTSGNITDRKIYEVLAIIVYFLDTITPTNTFREKLKALLAKYPNIDVTTIGFPKNWQDDPFWGCP